MTYVQRITFVSDEEDLGQDVTDSIISKVSRENACRHMINEAVFEAMRHAGVSRMICPDCGTKCTLPPVDMED